MELLLASSHFFKQKFLLFWLSSLPICAIVRPEAAEVVLKSNSMLDKPSTYKNSVTWLGDGLVFSTGIFVYYFFFTIFVKSMQRFDVVAHF